MFEVGAGTEIWLRNMYGNLWRGNKMALANQRAAVWTLMRRPMPGTGVVLSYPVIAALCGMTTHSTIVEAVHRAGRASA
jgi:hypothetical protein